MKFYQFKKYTTQYLVTIVVSVIFGALSTLFLAQYFFNDPLQKFSAIRENNLETPLIRPLLAYNTPEVQESYPLKKSLVEIIDKKNKAVTSVAVYYRDLTTGKWFGINQDETFVPASLFKVPLMITYLKYAEKNPKVLTTKIYNSLTRDENQNETIRPLKSIVQGESYTIDQLLSYMIEYSDNNATVLLFKYIDQETLKQVFFDLDIQLPATDLNSDFISVSNYSFLFRVLYNATYLNQEMSEKGLELLSKIDFEDGIRKNIPKSVSVADKFGEYYLIQNTKKQEHQLHDCGIVYHIRHPYILCIMTKGDTLDDLKKILQEISKVTYQSINHLE